MFITDSVVEISDGFMSECRGLPSVTFGASRIERIGADAFCARSLESLPIPDGVVLGTC